MCIEVYNSQRFSFVQVIDAVLRRHGLGCLLEWVESDIILKEKTVNIQVSLGLLCNP